MRRVLVSLVFLMVGLGLGFAASQSRHVGRALGTLRLLVLPRDPGLVSFFDASRDQRVVGVLHVPLFAIPNNEKARGELEKLLASIEETSSINVALDVDAVALGDNDDAVARGRFRWSQIETRLVEHGFTRTVLAGHPALTTSGTTVALAAPYLVYGRSPAKVEAALQRHDRDELKPDDAILSKLDAMGWRRTALIAITGLENFFPFGDSAIGGSLDTRGGNYHFAAIANAGEDAQRLVSDLDQIRREAIAEIKESTDPDAPVLVKALERATLKASKQTVRAGIVIPERLILRLWGFGTDTEHDLGVLANFAFAHMPMTLHERAEAEAFPETTTAPPDATIEAPTLPDWLTAIRWEPFAAAALLLGLVIGTLRRRQRPSLLRTAVRPTFVAPLALAAAGIPAVAMGDPAPAWLMSAIAPMLFSFFVVSRPKLHGAGAGLALGVAGVLGSSAVLAIPALKPMAVPGLGTVWLAMNALLCLFIARAFLRTERPTQRA